MAELKLTGGADRVKPNNLARPSGAVRFVIQRPEHPEWFAGWEHGLALWACEAGDAKLVWPDELVDTLTRLASESPFASLYRPK
jgi:hypothetical protein